MALAIPLNINIFDRSPLGVPSSNYLTDLGGIASQYEQTIGASIGFESMTTELTTTMEEALDWLQVGLMRSVQVWDIDANEIWEGFITAVEATFPGGESRSRSLDGMANYVYMRYTDEDGLTQVASVTAEPSRALYGTKKRVYSRGTTYSGAATTAAENIISQVGYPISSYAATVATGDGGGVRLRISASGWYTVLGWLFAAESSGGTFDIVAVLVKALLTAYNAENAFLSTDYSQITANTGTDVPDVDRDMTYRTKIEKLFGIGDGSTPAQRLCYGMYEGRRLRANTWAGATPDVATYIRHLYERRVCDAKGNTVPLWLVRPDAIYQVAELNDVLPIALTPNTATQSFVERTAFSVGEDSISLRIEGQGGSTIDEVLARIV